MNGDRFKFCVNVKNRYKILNWCCQMLFAQLRQHYPKIVVLYILELLNWVDN